MTAPSLQDRFRQWLSDRPDDAILNWLYRGLVVATLAVLVLDYGEIEAFTAERTASLPSTQQPSAEPLPARKSGTRPATPRQTDAKLREPMSFDLGPDGRLFASGTIMPGTAKAFADEIAKRGAYVKTVVLRSPGGSVRDALAIGRLIREKKFSTEVEPGRYCASSCPLVFAGGVERKAGANALIGVHQVAAIGTDGLSAAAGMENAQQISATCQNFLRDMGVDLGVWVHAMETPHNELYYFKPDELVQLKLATETDSAARNDKSAKR